MGIGPNNPIANPLGANQDLSNVAPIAPVSFNNQRLIDVANPVDAQDVVTLDFFNNNPPAGAANIPLDNILPVATVSFNSQKLADVADPTNLQDVVTLNYYNNNPSAGAANQQLSNLLPTAVNEGFEFPAGNSAFFLRTGAQGALPSSTITVRTGDSPSSTGDIFIQSGQGLSSGQILMQTGTGVGSQSGVVFISSGTGSAAPSGQNRIQSGNSTGAGAFDTGNMIVASGDVVGGTNDGTSGQVFVFSGDTAGLGTSGPIFVRSGASNFNSGILQITTGNAQNNSGDITVSTGTAVALRGSITLSAQNISLNPAGFINYNSRPNQDHVWQSGITANRPFGVVGMTYFDTTLGIPIWFDGATWVDATGTIV